MGLTELGYVLPTYDEILSGQINKAKELFGDDINTDTNTALGKFIRITTDELLNLYEMISDTYFSRFPQFATGINLDRLGTFAGITRNQATYAQHRISLAGTENHVVPQGFMVGTSNGLNFYTVSELILNEGDTEVSVMCVASGTDGNVAVGQITDIVNPDPNVTKVTHLSLEVAGEDIETDLNFYNRFKQAISGSGNTTYSSISGHISKISGVNSVNVIENDTDEAVNGLPSRSFQVFVHGDTASNEDIAKAIFEKKPPGIKAFGDIQVVVKDDGGYEHLISFSRTTVVDIQIRLTIKTTNLFETTGISDIQTALALSTSETNNDFDIVLNSMYGAVYKTAGVKEISKFEARHKVGTTGTWSEWSTNNILTTSSQIPRILKENVSVIIDNS